MRKHNALCPQSIHPYDNSTDIFLQAFNSILKNGNIFSSYIIYTALLRVCVHAMSISFMCVCVRCIQCVCACLKFIVPRAWTLSMPVSLYKSLKNIPVKKFGIHVFSYMKGGKKVWSEKERWGVFSRFYQKTQEFRPAK